MEGINEVSAIADAEEVRRATIECLIVGGLGGTMPTLTRLGAALVTESDPSLPHPAFLIGLAIYFIIGAVLVYAFSETSLKRAFLAGIAAPALIANVVAGVQEASDTRPESVANPSVETRQGAVAGLWFIRTAHAQTLPPTKAPASHEPEQAAPARESADAADTAQEYVYRIETRTHGQGDVVMEIISTQEDGETRSLTMGGYSVLELKTKQPLTSIQVLGPGKSQSITLSEEQKQGATVDIDAAVARKRGFLWALGGRDTPTVQQLTIGVEALDSTSNTDSSQ